MTGYHSHKSWVLMNLTWKVFYWASLLFTLAVCPLLVEYESSGEFSRKARLQAAASSNIRWWCIVGLTLSAVLLVYCVHEKKIIDLTQLTGACIALSNAWGVVCLILLLGFGVTDWPRRVKTLSSSDAVIEGMYGEAFAVNEWRLSARYQLDQTMGAVIRSHRPDGHSTSLTTLQRAIPSTLSPSPSLTPHPAPPIAHLTSLAYRYRLAVLRSLCSSAIDRSRASAHAAVSDGVERVALVTALKLTSPLTPKTPRPRIIRPLKPLPLNLVQSLDGRIKELIEVSEVSEVKGMGGDGEGRFMGNVSERRRVEQTSVEMMAKGAREWGSKESTATRGPQRSRSEGLENGGDEEEENGPVGDRVVYVDETLSEVDGVWGEYDTEVDLSAEYGNRDEVDVDDEYKCHFDPSEIDRDGPRQSQSDFQVNNPISPKNLISPLSQNPLSHLGDDEDLPSDLQLELISLHTTLKSHIAEWEKAELRWAFMCYDVGCWEEMREVEQSDLDELVEMLVETEALRRGEREMRRRKADEARRWRRMEVNNSARDLSAVKCQQPHHLTSQAPASSSTDAIRSGEEHNSPLGESHRTALLASPSSRRAPTDCSMGEARRVSEVRDSSEWSEDYTSSYCDEVSDHIFHCCASLKQTMTKMTLSALCQVWRIFDRKFDEHLQQVSQCQQSRNEGNEVMMTPVHRPSSSSPSSSSSRPVPAVTDPSRQSFSAEGKRLALLSSSSSQISFDTGAKDGAGPRQADRDALTSTNWKGDDVYHPATWMKARLLYVWYRQVRKPVYLFFAYILFFVGVTLVISESTMHMKHRNLSLWFWTMEYVTHGHSGKLLASLSGHAHNPPHLSHDWENTTPPYPDTKKYNNLTHIDHLAHQAHRTSQPLNTESLAGESLDAPHRQLGVNDVNGLIEMIGEGGDNQMNLFSPHTNPSFTATPHPPHSAWSLVSTQRPISKQHTPGLQHRSPHSPHPPRKESHPHTHHSKPPNTQTGVHLIIPLLVCSSLLLFMVLATNHGIYCLRISGRYGVHRCGKSTETATMIMFTSLVSRLTAPLCYNFITLLRLEMAGTGTSGATGTAFASFYGASDDVPIIGHAFNIYFPLFVLFVWLCNIFNVYEKVLTSVMGVTSLDYDASVQPSTALPQTTTSSSGAPQSPRALKEQRAREGRRLVVREESARKDMVASALARQAANIRAASLGGGMGRVDNPIHLMAGVSPYGGNEVGAVESGVAFISTPLSSSISTTRQVEVDHRGEVGLNSCADQTEGPHIADRSEAHLPPFGRSGSTHDSRLKAPPHHYFQHTTLSYQSSLRSSTSSPPAAFIASSSSSMSSSVPLAASPSPHLAASSSKSTNPPSSSTTNPGPLSYSSVSLQPPLELPLSLQQPPSLTPVYEASPVFATPLTSPTSLTTAQQAAPTGPPSPVENTKHQTAGESQRDSSEAQPPGSDSFDASDVYDIEDEHKTGGVYRYLIDPTSVQLGIEGRAVVEGGTLSEPAEHSEEPYGIKVTCGERTTDTAGDIEPHNGTGSGVTNEDGNDLHTDDEASGASFLQQVNAQAKRQNYHDADSDENDDDGDDDDEDYQDDEY
eukprot:GHVN01051218.1.p1 GENE.GHVN01051218.1~~GHVN01051218.1.p1  ORF type:complete len:1720 (+),score=489.61 GHVN01051218.1:429-5162(+)